MYSWKFHFTNILIALALSGCVTPVSTNIKPSSAHVAKYSDLPALDVVASLEKNVNEARNANMPFLAPNYFREASQVLSECQSALTNKPKEIVANNAAKGDAILEKGRSVMAIVRYRFAKELDFKDQLDQLNTTKLLPREYMAVVGELSKLIEIVEREQPGSIDKEKEILMKSMSELLIKSVQVGALRESEAINEENKKNNAEKLAPLTYSEALHVFQESKNGIATSFRDQALVQHLGEAALFAARHAKHVNDRVALLQSQLKINPVSSAPVVGAMGNISNQASIQGEGKSIGTEKVTVEKIVLQEEDRLLSISRELKLKDLRDLPLERQVEEIIHAAADAALQPNGRATLQDYEARLEAANKGIQQGQADLIQKDKQLSEKDKQLADKDKQLADKDKQLADKDRQPAEKDKQLSDKDKQLAEKDKQLADKDKQLKTLKNKLLSMKLL